jgi:hypothetical protein
MNAMILILADLVFWNTCYPEVIDVNSSLSCNQITLTARSVFAHKEMLNFDSISPKRHGTT